MNRLNKNKDKDYLLKLTTKLLFEELGYYPFYEVKLRNKSYMTQFKTHDISDIDVLGFNILHDLSVYKVGAECKSGENAALEELFKFSGIMKHYNLSQGYLIKSKIHQNAREISLNQNIICYSESELRQILISFDNDLEKQLDIENAKYLSMQEALDVGKKYNEKMHSYITLDYWNKDNWKNIHNIMHLLSHQEEKNLFDEKNIKISQFCYYIMELFSLALILNISKAIKMSYSDIERSIEVSLYGNAEEYNEKRKIHDAVSIATKTIEKFEPEWQVYLINIAKRFSQKPKEASQIVKLFKDISENSFYKDKIVINERMLKKYSELTIKFAQDICNLIINYTLIDKDNFIDLMNK